MQGSRHLDRHLPATAVHLETCRWALPVRKRKQAGLCVLLPWRANQHADTMTRGFPEGAPGVGGLKPPQCIGTYHGTRRWFMYYHEKAWLLTDFTCDTFGAEHAVRTPGLCSALAPRYIILRRMTAAVSLACDSFQFDGPVLPLVPQVQHKGSFSQLPRYILRGSGPKGRRSL